MRRTRVTPAAAWRHPRSALAAAALAAVTALVVTASARADDVRITSGPDAVSAGGSATSARTEAMDGDDARPPGAVPAGVRDPSDGKPTPSTGGGGHPTEIVKPGLGGSSHDPYGDGTQAAVRHDWGEPLPVSDEFDHTGPVDPERWATPSGDVGGTEGCWEGHTGNGRRCAKNSVVADGILTMTGEANGDTGWIRQRHDAHYGRWEIRSRSYNTGPEGETYHPLHLIWPTEGNRLENGEYDWVEYTDPDASCLGAWLHYPQSPTDEKEHFEDCSVDMTQWHNFAFEWSPGGLVGYVDGKEYFRMADGADDERGNIQDMPLGNLTIQLDNFTGTSGIRPAAFEVDWVRTYAYQ